MLDYLQAPTARLDVLTNHAHVLVWIARDPGICLREIGQRVGITERAAHRIAVELAGAGSGTRERNGRRSPDRDRPVRAAARSLGNGRVIAGPAGGGRLPAGGHPRRAAHAAAQFTTRRETLNKPALSVEMEAARRILKRGKRTRQPGGS